MVDHNDKFDVLFDFSFRGIRVTHFMLLAFRVARNVCRERLCVAREIAK